MKMYLIYDLYCISPPGGHWDVLASLVGTSHVVHLYIESQCSSHSIQKHLAAEQTLRSWWRLYKAIIEFCVYSLLHDCSGRTSTGWKLDHVNKQRCAVEQCFTSSTFPSSFTRLKGLKKKTFFHLNKQRWHFLGRIVSCKHYSLDHDTQADGKSL